MKKQELGLSQGIGKQEKRLTLGVDPKKRGGFI
jgi:hypothetical protein